MTNDKELEDEIPNKFYWNYKYHLDNNKLPDGIMDFETLKGFFYCHNNQIKEARKELIEELRCNSKYKLGYFNALDDVKKMIKDEIINEEESIKRKAVRDWDILKELRFVLFKIQELRSEKK